MNRLIFELVAPGAVRFVPVELRRAGRAIVEPDPSDPLCACASTRPSLHVAARVTIVLAAMATACGGPASSRPAKSLPARPAATERSGTLPPSAPALPDQLTLPAALAPARSRSGDGLRVLVSHRRIYLDQPPQAVTDLPDLPTMRLHGTGLKNKRGPNDLLVVPLDAALQRIPTDRKREAVIFCDKEIPLRVLLEVLFTLAQSESEFWLLATDEPGSVGRPIRGWQTAVPNRLGREFTSVFLSSTGYVVSVAEQNIAPGCGRPGDGIAVPTDDPSALRACLSSVAPIVKAQAGGDVRDPKLLALGGDRDVPYQTLISAMSAAHGAGYERFSLRVWR